MNINIFKSMFYVMVLIILLDGCSKSTSEAEFIKKAEVFHNNFNNDRHDINYEILKKNSGMSASKDDYVKTFSFVKSRLGHLKSVKLLNVNFSQTTFAGEKLVRVSFDSYFYLGVAKEFFYFLSRVICIGMKFTRKIFLIMKSDVTER